VVGEPVVDEPVGADDGVAQAVPRFVANVDTEVVVRAGSTPHKPLFPSSCIERMLVSSPSSVGRVPVRLFRSRYIIVMLVSSPSSVGRVPVRLFPPRPIVPMLVSSHSSVGRVPVRPFPLRY